MFFLLLNAVRIIILNLAHLLLIIIKSHSQLADENNGIVLQLCCSTLLFLVSINGSNSRIYTRKHLPNFIAGRPFHICKC